MPGERAQAGAPDAMIAYMTRRAGGPKRPGPRRVMGRHGPNTRKD